MSSTIIRNIIHKYLDSDIQILYEPAYSLIDHMVFDLPYNFILNKPYKIQKDNVIYTSDINLFSYDMFFNYGTKVNDTGHRLHVPTLQYIPSFIAETLDIAHNVLYILEGSNNTNHDMLQPVDIPWPSVSLSADKLYDTVLLNCGLVPLDTKIIEFFKEKIANIHILSNPGDLYNISQYKTVIDLYPSDMSNLLFALKHKTVYITTPRPNTNAYKQLYDNIILGSMVLDIIEHNLNALKTYSVTMFEKDIAGITNLSWSQQISDNIQKLKHTGFYIS